MGTIKLGSLATGHSIEGMDSTEDPEKKLQSSKEVRGKPEENEVTDIEGVKTVSRKDLPTTAKSKQDRRWHLAVWEVGDHL